MKKTELTETKTISAEELIKKVTLLKGELADLILEKQMGKLKNKKSVFKKRKDLSQIMTILRQKQLLSELELNNVNDKSTNKKEGGKQIEVVADDLAESVKKKSKVRAKSVQNK